MSGFSFAPFAQDANKRHDEKGRFASGGAGAPQMRRQADGSLKDQADRYYIHMPRGSLRHAAMLNTEGGWAMLGTFETEAEAVTAVKDHFINRKEQQ